MYVPSASDLRRSRDFLGASRPPLPAAAELARRGEPLLAVLGLVGLGDRSWAAEPGTANPQGGEEGEDVADRAADAAPGKRDALADFLYVRPGHAAASAAAHAANAMFAVAHEMVMVALPSVTQLVGGDVVTFSNLRALANCLNLAGGVAVGALTDAAGPKLGLLASHASAALAFSMIGVAPSVPMLYAAMVPKGAIHTFQVTMYVCTVHSGGDQRARALGRVGALYGLGCFCGSLALVLALRFLGPREVALLAAAIEGLAFVVVALGYPATEPDPLSPDVGGAPLGATAGPAGGGASSGAPGVLAVLRRPGVPQVLTFKLLLTVSAGAVLFMVQQFAFQPFGFSPSQVALLTAYLGGLHMASQALASDDVAPRTLFVASTVGVAGSLLGMAASPPTAPAFVAWLAPLCVSYHAANVMLGSLLTLYVPMAEMGSAMGLGLATMSVGQMVALPLSARLFRARGFSAVPLAAGGLLLAQATWILLVDYVPPWHGELPLLAEVDGGHSGAGQGGVSRAVCIEAAAGAHARQA